MFRRLLPYGLLLGLATGSAGAHDMWLEPATFTPASGATVPIGLWVGHGVDRDPVPRQESRILRFESLSADGGGRDLAGVAGTHPAGVLRNVPPGATAVVYVSDDAFSSLPAGPFHDYLLEEGLEGIVEARKTSGTSAEPGRERFSRSLKSLLTAGGGPPRDREAGIPLELTIQGLEEIDRGYRVTLRLTLRSRPLAGALIDAEPLDAVSHDTPAVGARSKEDGTVRFDLAAGSWKLAAVHMEAVEAPDADWKSLWTTLTFHLPPRR